MRDGDEQRRVAHIADWPVRATLLMALGAVVTHPMVHIAAEVHQRDGGSTQMLPAEGHHRLPSHGDSDVTAGSAAELVRGQCRVGD